MRNAERAQRVRAVIAVVQHHPLFAADDGQEIGAEADHEADRACDRAVAADVGDLIATQRNRVVRAQIGRRRGEQIAVRIEFLDAHGRVGAIERQTKAKQRVGRWCGAQKPCAFGRKDAGDMLLRHDQPVEFDHANFGCEGIERRFEIGIGAQLIGKRFELGRERQAIRLVGGTGLRLFEFEIDVVGGAPFVRKQLCGDILPAYRLVFDKAQIVFERRLAEQPRHFGVERLLVRAGNVEVGVHPAPLPPTETPAVVGPI